MDTINPPPRGASNTTVQFLFTLPGAITAGLPPGFVAGDANTPVFGPFTFFPRTLPTVRLVRRSTGTIGEPRDTMGRGITTGFVVLDMADGAAPLFLPCEGRSPASDSPLYYPERDTRDAVYSLLVDTFADFDALAGLYDVYGIVPVFPYNVCRTVTISGPFGSGGSSSVPIVPFSPSGYAYRKASFEIIGTTTTPPPPPDPPPADPCGCHWTRGPEPVNNWTVADVNLPNTWTRGGCGNW